MTSLFPRRAMRRLDFRLRTYGVTAALGVFTLGGVLPQCAPPPPPPPIVQVAEVQHPAVRAINEARARAGLRAVVVDSRLTAAARGHSNHMARTRNMTHVGAGGSDPGQRITAAGYRWRTYGENVAAGQPTAAAAVKGWLSSPGHRANIMNRGVVHVGVAATKSNGRTYWTMVVAAPR